MPFRSSKVGFAAPPGQRSIAGAFADDFAVAAVGRIVVSDGHLGEGAADLASNLLDAQDLLSNALDLYDGGDDQDDSSELAHVSEGMTAQVTAALAALQPAQRAAVERHLGPPEVIAYRLAESRPLHRGPRATMRSLHGASWCDEVRELERLGLAGNGELALRLAVAEAHHAVGHTGGAAASLAVALKRLWIRVDDIPEGTARERYLTQVPVNARLIALGRAWLGEEAVTPPSPGGPGALA